jgi:hypothetical protein
MKKFKLLLILATCIICKNFAYVPFFDEPKTIILANPRTGGHWLMYSLMSLTNRHISTANHSIYLSEKNVYNPWNLEYNFSQPSIYFTRSISYLDKIDYETDKVILLVRDFKESLLRENNESIEKLFKILKNPKNSYYKIFKEFEKFQTENRVIVYYEDLLTNPAESITNILKFLGNFDQKKVTTFVKNIDTHKKESIDVYNKNPAFCGKSLSMGEDLLWHSKLVRKDMLQFCDYLVKNKASDVWRKYLNRYETN